MRWTHRRGRRSTAEPPEASQGCPTEPKETAMWRPTTSPTRTRRGARAVAALAATAALCAVPAASGTGAATAAPYCGITWGSLAKTSAPLAVGRVDGVRAGRHACFDRLVLDMTGPAPGFAVCYVTTVLNEEAGFAVPVAGGARLAVVAHKGATTVPTMPSVAGFTTFRQVKWAGSSNPTGAGAAPGPTAGRLSRWACAHACPTGCSRCTTPRRTAAGSSWTSPTAGEIRPGRRQRRRPGRAGRFAGHSLPDGLTGPPPARRKGWGRFAVLSTFATRSAAHSRVMGWLMTLGYVFEMAGLATAALGPVEDVRRQA